MGQRTLKRAGSQLKMLTWNIGSFNHLAESIFRRNGIVCRMLAPHPFVKREIYHESKRYPFQKCVHK